MVFLVPIMVHHLVLSQLRGKTVLLRNYARCFLSSVPTNRPVPFSATLGDAASKKKTASSGKSFGAQKKSLNLFGIVRLKAPLSSDVLAKVSFLHLKPLSAPASNCASYVWHAVSTSARICETVDEEMLPISTEISAISSFEPQARLDDRQFSVVHFFCTLPAGQPLFILVVF